MSKRQVELLECYHRCVRGKGSFCIVRGVLVAPPGLKNWGATVLGGYSALVRSKEGELAKLIERCVELSHTIFLEMIHVRIHTPPPV
jgi:hypothetical protein